MSDDVRRLFRELVGVLADTSPDRLNRAIQASEIYLSLVPYRRFRSILGFEANQDYELSVLRLLAGFENLVTLDPPNAQDELAEEARSLYPNPGIIRDYAAVKVYLRDDAVSRALAERSRFEPQVGERGAGSGERETPGEPGAGSGEPETPGEPGAGSGERDVTASDCRYCERPLPEGRRVAFCPWCGRDQRVRECPRCLAELQEGWVYCVECGAEADGEE